MALWRHDRVCTKSGIIGLNLFVLWLSRSTSTHCAPGKKVSVPIYKVLVRPGWESDQELSAPKRTHLPPGHGLDFRTRVNEQPTTSMGIGRLAGRPCPPWF